MAIQDDIAKLVGTDTVYKGPVFGEVLPFYQAWESLLPMYQEEARAQISPFIQRQLQRDLGQLNRNLAGSGMWRFSGARSGGGIKANAQREQTAQELDWLGQRQQGFKELFYDPAEQAWTRAIQLGQNPDIPNPLDWYRRMQGGSGQRNVMQLPNTVDFDMSKRIGDRLGRSTNTQVGTPTRSSLSPQNAQQLQPWSTLYNR